MDGFLHFEGHFKPQHTEIIPANETKNIKTSWDIQSKKYDLDLKKLKNKKKENNDHPKILYRISSTVPSFVLERGAVWSDYTT